MKRCITFLLFLLLLVCVFKNWLMIAPLSSGDWGFNFGHTIKSYSIYPYVWSWTGFASGLGGNISFFLGLSSFYSGTAHFFNTIIGIPWVIVERVIWFWPFLLISTTSSFLLFRKLFSSNFSIFSSLIYLFNTYILMVIGGGQMGVAMAYSLAPLALLIFILLFEKNELKSLQSSLVFSLLAGLVLSIELFFDIRIAYVVLVAVFIFWLIKNILNKDFKYLLNSILVVFLIPGTICILLNLFWILPTIFIGKNPIDELGSAYSSIESVRYFSFAKFENSISLLHPNWPENIFGKVGFIKPEFLFLPIIAFSSLLFFNDLKNMREKVYLLFFSALGILGIFLAKGANDPFGQIYLLLFNYMPGFFMFRDPTKWYVLISISYSILIPFTIWKVYELLKSRSDLRLLNFKINIRSNNDYLNMQNLFLIVVMLILLYLIKPVFFNQMSGTFKSSKVPDDYIKFEQFLSSEENFSRTLWIPTQQRYGFYSSTHPILSSRDFFKIYDDRKIADKLEMQSSKRLLGEAAIKYVVVAYDNKEEIYLTDRKYDEAKYDTLVEKLDKISWLKKEKEFGKIIVYEAPSYRDHFWCDCNASVSYRFINPTKYTVDVKNAARNDVLVFSEKYDSQWELTGKNYSVNSIPYNKIFNSFRLPEGDGSYDVNYRPQKYVDFGLKVSLITLLTLLVIILIFIVKKYKKW